MDKKVLAVVVTYNRKKLLKECISALLSQSYEQLKILIVDNASTDGTEEVVKRFTEPQISYVNTGANLGGAGGFQFGIREGMKLGADYLWLMDDDSIPTKSALQGLMFSANNLGNFGFLSSKVLWKDHTMCRMNVPKVSIYHKLRNFDGSPKRIEMATFVSFLVPTKVVERVGLPIKEFFIWSDDLEYSSRIAAKYPCYFIPTSVIVHKCKSNNGSNIVSDSPERLGRYKYAYRNEVFVYRRAGFLGWLHIILKDTRDLGQVITNSKNYKEKRMRIIVRSFLKGLEFNPKIEYVQNKSC